MGVYTPLPSTRHKFLDKLRHLSMVPLNVNQKSEIKDDIDLPLNAASLAL